jgi:hypothetical protein
MAQIIYEPKGKALEYAHLCCNLYSGGCPHKCVYCYVPSALQKNREQWLLEPYSPRKDIIKNLRKEAPKLAGTNKRVHLCFTCDPYNPVESSAGVTRQALQIFREYRIPFQVLTKGGMLATRDFDLYGPEDTFGVTLTCLSDLGSKKYEPGAAPTSERIKALRMAREKGIFTWVSLEPVLGAPSTIELINATHEFVCHYKIGPLNHGGGLKCPSEDYTVGTWRQFGYDVVELCEKFSVSYFIKYGLAKNMDGLKWKQTDTRTLPREPLKTGKVGLFE